MAHFGEELAFLKTQAISLRNIPVTFENDYQPALQDVPRKVPVFPVSLYLNNEAFTIRRSLRV